MFGLGLLLGIFPRQFTLAPFRPFKVQGGLVHLGFLLPQLFLIADILCDIHANRDQAPIKRGALHQFDPALGVELQQGRLRIFQRGVF